ncbi:hypothetical protein [Sphaerotilus microaerophilus]|uniref:Uncharacterized protein n=1 Tax=Sphaerotilus microaerophilus TaxID=2914710 RepID=A0ABN6PTN0_9BURK|nr:hypothetical protein [Sphaerotilus sp. FB-5]BDI07462.1 hypothetical protein CATMQ487_44320 [Sphaerotilus sp. FB-5]
MTSMMPINNDLLNLWKSPLANGQTLAPIQYPDVLDDPIVFVGMNPSFSVAGWKSLQQHNSSGLPNPATVFQWPNPVFNQQHAITWEQIALQNYAYFKWHRQLACIVGNPWYHLDLFAVRETNQTALTLQVLKSLRPLSVNPFGTAQLDIFDQAIDLIRPKAVVVANALASRIYLDRRTPGRQSGCCCHIDSTTQGYQFPVFFSGMLTGQRALDIFSRERLFCQVSKHLERSKAFEDWCAGTLPDCREIDFDRDLCGS